MTGAEWLYSPDSLVAGELVCVDAPHNTTVKRCTHSADAGVIGIVSTNPGFVGNSIGGAKGSIPPHYYLVGFIGQIPVKAVVTSSPDAIHPGDSLTTASIPGFARK